MRHMITDSERNRTDLLGGDVQLSKVHTVASGFVHLLISAKIIIDDVEKHRMVFSSSCLWKGTTNFGTVMTNESTSA